LQSGWESGRKRKVERRSGEAPKSSFAPQALRPFKNCPHSFSGPCRFQVLGMGKRPGGEGVLSIEVSRKSHRVRSNSSRTVPGGLWAGGERKKKGGSRETWRRPVEKKK